MILDARRGDRDYWVYDAERCVIMRFVVWVDDGTNEYGTYANFIVGGEWATLTHKVRKVAIYTDRRLVIINPVEDSEDARADAIATTELVHQ